MKKIIEKMNLEEQIIEINNISNIELKRVDKKKEVEKRRINRIHERKEKKRKQELLNIDSGLVRNKESGLHRCYDSCSKGFTKFISNKKVRKNICASGGYHKNFVSNY